MSEETTGFGQAPVYRDRKTGRRRDFAAEAREQTEKDEKRQELEEKYAQWGRGSVFNNCGDKIRWNLTIFAIISD